MKSFHASFLFVFLTASPDLQAWGLPVGVQGPQKTTNPPVSKTATTSPSKAVASVTVKRPRAAVRETSIRLRQPSLLEQARTLTEQEILARFDTDLDGKLNAKESSAARMETEKRRGLKAGLLKRFDDNKNKRLDAAEMSRARAEFAANRRKQTLTKYDRNHNGLLDPVERKCLQADRERQLALLRIQRRFDANHDGVLNGKESSALKRYQAEQKRKGLDPLDTKGLDAKVGIANVGIREASEKSPGGRKAKGSKPAGEATKTTKQKAKPPVPSKSSKKRGDLERSPTRG